MKDTKKEILNIALAILVVLAMLVPMNVILVSRELRKIKKELEICNSNQQKIYRVLEGNHVFLEYAGNGTNKNNS